jgi:type 1 glutamine amidotransferase
MRSNMTQRKALIVRGGWKGHQPVEATELFIPFLERSGYAVQVEEMPTVYADDETMSAVDLVVQCITMSDIASEEVAGLSAAVAAGTGFTGWHGGIVDSFRASSDYLHLVGGQFACHPGKDPDKRCGDGEDFYLPHTVNITDLGRRHPITAGIEDFDLNTEQYWVLHDDLIDVLATTVHATQPWQPWQRPSRSPVVWTRRWGAGRVVVTTAGHNLDVLKDSNVRVIIERGMLWAARTA